MFENPIILIATTDADRARAFYEETMGLSFVGDAGPALVFDLAGVPLRVQKVGALTPAQHTVLGWSVPDIAAAVTTLRSRGVSFESYPGLDQDSDGIWSSPAGARVAWFRDPDGNTLSLTQA